MPASALPQQGLLTAFYSSVDTDRRMCDKTFLLLPLRWCVANYQQNDDEAVLVDDQEADYPWPCAAKGLFGLDCRTRLSADSGGGYSKD